MSRNSGRYSSYAQFMACIVIILGFIGRYLNRKLDKLGTPVISCTKISKSFYITKLNYTTASTIKGLGIRQTFRG